MMFRLAGGVVNPESLGKSWDDGAKEDGVAVDELSSAITGEFSSFRRTSGKLLIGLSSDGSRALNAGSFRLARISAACAAIR